MIWHFYDPATGLMLRKRLVCPRSQLEGNTPAGMLPIPGEFDPLSQRVDITAEPPPPAEPGPELGQEPPPEWWPPVVDYQPPAPEGDALRTWAWDAASKRWVSSPTLLAIKRAKRQELAQAWQTEFRGGMDSGSVRVPTHAEAITDYLLLRQMAADGDWINTPVELADGTFQVLTQAQAGALWAALKTHRRTLLAKLRDKAALVQAAADAAAVAAITWGS